MIHIEHEDNSTQHFDTIKETKLNGTVTTAKVLLASGHELSYILDKFSMYDSKGHLIGYSIPVPNPATDVVWFGDIAKTILANL